MKHTVAVGDWSDDGHGKHRDYVVEIPDMFTPEILGDNFRKNVAEIGFGPHSFAEDYEDSLLPADKLAALVDSGFDAEELENMEDEEGVHLTPSDMLKIVMHYFGRGLDLFTYEVQNDKAPALIGYWSNVTAGADGDTRSRYGVSVGYGLFI